MKTKKHDGFTLVEILIAITIFCFAVLGLAIGTVSVIRTNQTSHLRASAVNLAQARLEELRAMTSAAFSGLLCPSSTHSIAPLHPA
jgi:prepilin-type N-terminal cleavage/methylation domain-containing protein